MSDETVRQTIMRRDGADALAVDDMFSEFEDALLDGGDPEEAMADTFGLEPDYLFSDAEVYGVMERALATRAAR